MILMYVRDRRSEAVRVAMPDVPLEWQAAGPSLVSLEQISRARQFVFSASSYDAIADAPVEAGKFEEFQITGITPPITVVVHGENWKRKRAEEDLKRICEYEIKLMEGAPFERYTFILHIGKGAGGGGMEHANSTAIGVPSDEFLPAVGGHEIFYLLYVERSRAAAQETGGYEKEENKRALWFGEGGTEQEASFALVRSGIWSKQQFYADLGEQISELEGRPAKRSQSAEQSTL